MATANELISLAASQIGVKESPSGSNKVKYWDYYKQHCGKNYNGSPWCAAFVTWCMSEVGAWKFTSDEGRFRYCPSLVSWAKSNGQWVDRSKGAKAGDIVLFGNGSRACHVGIVEKVINSTTLQTIEGNTSTTSNDNGGSVMRRTRAYGTAGSSWYVMGFVRTPWDAWVRNYKGWWYRYADGSWPSSKWLKLDAWYYFDDGGYAVTGWRKINGYWYYFGSDCRMQTGWKKIKNKWYYLHPQKEKDHKGAEWPEGSAHIGWIKTNGKWYYCNKASEGTECAMREGWLDWEGGRYYLKPGNGDMACNETMTIDGKSYTFDNSGAMK